MAGFDDFDWRSATQAQQLAVARRADAAQLRWLACGYDWKLHPEAVLGWVMAQKCVDLGAALTAFLNGGPERFNYIPKRDVPAAYLGATRVLDTICLRVNSGFYLACPGCCVDGRPRLDRWLAYQAADRAEGRRGRWILDERIVSTLRDAPARPPGSGKAQDSGPGIRQAVLGRGMRRIGLSRRVMGWLPGRG